jgi:hypothetical protein
MENIPITLKSNEHYDVKTRNYTGAKLVRDILREEHAKGKMLFVDGSTSITRMGSDDPINQYFGGRENDIYRVEDLTSMRYRIVYNLTDKNTARDVKKTIAPLSALEMLERAKITLTELYADRRYSFTDITPPDGVEVLHLVGEKGQHRLYTVTVHIDFMKKNLASLFKDEQLVTTIDEIQSRPEVPEFNYEKIEQSCVEYAKYARIIVIYDNPMKLNLPVKMKHTGNLFLQFIAIQQLQFNISKHVLQPKMTLLDRVTDRDEIVELYRLNGLELNPDKTLGDYNIVADTKLIIL